MQSSTIDEPTNKIPRLAIWRLGMWMACVAAVEAWRGISLAPLEASWQMQLLQLASRLSYCTLAGLSLAGLMLALGGALKLQRGYPTTGGHWLLAAAGAVTLLCEACNVIIDARHQANPAIKQTEIASQAMIHYFALIALLYLGCARAVRDAWPWRLLFLAYAVPGLFWSITHGMLTFGNSVTGDQWSKTAYALQWPWQWLLVVAVLSLAGFDLVRRRRRDWLHWTGIGYVLCSLGSESILQALHAWISN